jgi:hypothetical protein
MEGSLDSIHIPDEILLECAPFYDDCPIDSISALRCKSRRLVEKYNPSKFLKITQASHEYYQSIFATNVKIIIALINKEMQDAHNYILLNFNRLQLLYHSEESCSSIFSGNFLSEYLNKVQEGDAHLSRISFSDKFDKKVKVNGGVIPREDSCPNHLNLLYKNSYLVINQGVSGSMNVAIGGVRKLTMFFFDPRGNFILVHFMKLNNMLKSHEEENFEIKFIRFYKTRMILFGRLISTIILIIKNMEGLKKVWGITLKDIHLVRLRSIQRMIQEQRIHWESLLE